MIDLRPTLFVTGIFLTILAAGMIIPAAIDLSIGHPNWKDFAVSSLTSFFIGISLILANRSLNTFNINLRTVFLMTTITWVVIASFAALPFHFSALNMSFTDSFFEAMSGITTTGATVITNLDSLPPGLLLWRGITQWLGGLGIVVMAVSILPFLQVGGMQMFKAEAFETGRKVLASAAHISANITLLFILLTFLCFLLLLLAGMSPLDASTHAMTTISTAGYSTHDASIGYYNNIYIEMIILFGMLISGMPFLLIQAATQGNLAALLKDSQVRAYLFFLSTATLVMSFWLIYTKQYSVLQSLRYASFNITSIMTGTGFTTTDFTNWGTFSLVFFFFLMFIGGCFGSTACGIKIFRFQILFSVVKIQIQKLYQPNAVMVPRFNQKPLDNDVISSVCTFFALFLLCFVILSLLLSLCGMDFITAISSAATAISNVGPGLGEIGGPDGTFSSLSSTAKWLMIIGMLLGRLEIFTVLVLLSPGFWKK